MSWKISWKFALAQFGVTIVICLVIMMFMFCCCIPVMRSLVIAGVQKQMVVQQRVGCLKETPDLFPIPDWEKVTDTSSESEEECEAN